MLIINFKNVSTIRTLSPYQVALQGFRSAENEYPLLRNVSVDLKYNVVCL